MTAARTAIVFVCQSCGATAPKWLGRCPECGEWNSFVEERAGPSRRGLAGARATSLAEIGPRRGRASRPGCPVSTACSAAASWRARSCSSQASPGSGSRRCCCRPAEGLAAEQRRRCSTPARRNRRARCGCVASGSASASAAAGAGRDDARGSSRRPQGARPAVLVVDSVQAIRRPALDSPAGTVRRCGRSRARADEYAKAQRRAGAPGRARHQGRLARGPKSLEHLVDAVCPSKASAAARGESCGPRRIASGPWTRWLSTR